MKPGARNLHQRVRSSDDSDQSTSPHEKIPDDVASPDQPKPSPPSGSSDPKLEALTSSQEHQTSAALKSARKSILIEIKGKTPPGKDGVFALNRDMKCEGTDLASNAELNPDFQGRKFEYKPSFVDYGSTVISGGPHAGSMLYRERLIDTRKVFPPGNLQARNTLDRVKRLQERAGMMDVKDRLRGRCSAALHQSRSYNAVQRFKGHAGFESMLAEKALLDVDSKHDSGVLKVSDRSLCENGE
jgi:hypothetical protein